MMYPAEGRFLQTATSRGEEPNPVRWSVQLARMRLNTNTTTSRAKNARRICCHFAMTCRVAESSFSQLWLVSTGQVSL